MDDSQNPQQPQNLQMPQEPQVPATTQVQEIPQQLPYSPQTVPPVQSIRPIEGGPVIIHHQAEGEVVEKPKKSLSKTMLLIVGNILALFAAVYLGVYLYLNHQVQLDKLTTPSISAPTVIPNQIGQTGVTPTAAVTLPPTVDPLPTWPQAALSNLTIKIPEGWWYGLAPKDPNTMYINPVVLATGIPAYTLTMSKNTTVASAKASWLASWKLVSPSENTMNLLGIDVTTVTGQTREKTPRTVTVAFIANKTDVYYLLDEGTADDHANTFDKMLSTMSLPAASALSPTVSASEGLAPVSASGSSVPNP